MSDYRNDPELQRLMAAAASIQPKVWKGAWQNNPVNADYKAANDALVNYIDQNRVRLGIPEGHYVNPVTGQVYKPQGTNWFKFGLLYGGMLAGGLGLQAMLGSGAAAASGAGAATTTTAGTVATAAKTGLGFADLLKAGGSAMGNAAETMAGNRGTRLDAEVTREALDQSRQQQRNANVDVATKNHSGLTTWRGQ